MTLKEREELRELCSIRDYDNLKIELPTETVIELLDELDKANRELTPDAEHFIDKRADYIIGGTDKIIG